MFGRYSFDLHTFFQDLEILVERKEAFYVYKRILGREKVEKVVSGGEVVIINPVEPVNLPKTITNYLQIKFPPIFVEPNGDLEVFLTLPIEIAVIVEKNGIYEDIDIFSFVKPKYSLYGSPASGVICRYWQSNVFEKIPEVESFKEGILKLRIVNDTNQWVEVKNAVFDVFGMQIFYGDFVSSIAEMRIVSKRVAETSFKEKPLFDSMKKSIELYVARKLPVIGQKFVMERGL